MSIYSYVYLAITAVLIGIIIYENVTGKHVFAKVDMSKPILEALKLLAKACAGVFPSAYFDNAAVIMEAAVNATVAAEKLWKAGEIDKDKRSEYCQLVIASTLKEAGIEVTEQVQEIIRGTIAMVCMLMPHSGLAEDVKKNELEADTDK